LKKLDLGQTISILANVGVIAGILFLAFELRQNNQILIAQTSYAQFSIERERRNRLIENVGGITDVMQKGRSGIPLTEDEAFRRNLVWEDLVSNWRWQFREVEAGRLPANILDVQTARVIWQANHPALANYFNETSSRYDAAFTQWIEENIVNGR